ncbi:Protein disks lost [Orchesella cincta]|uniref:Protein disks lost n=1 Tax=Orchesella cincta TaxID=48709 RepID=A0A1D2N7F1_ORCCI|nr:Protein disks lost [Orchesella cincta]
MDPTPSRKTPRSAKLFAELSADRRQKLDEMAEKYSKSIDTNQCRNVLDELEFLFQLFNTTNNNAPKSVSGQELEVPLLFNAAEQAYFVIKVVIGQLDKIIFNLPTYVLQLIIDNYPHKIPKPVRKHIEDWIIAQKSKAVPVSVEEPIRIDLGNTVCFQSEKDGRANFPNQNDFHAFCKQRDMFYSIRDTWTSSSNSSPVGLITDRSKSRMSFPPVNPTPLSRADSLSIKVQSLFQLNRNPTNLYHMASLFVSHYLLEARAQEIGGIPKDDHMQEFFQSNPTKLLQLNSRVSTSAETLESDQSPKLAFQKQFLLSCSPKFVQHVVDRLLMEIIQTEEHVETNNVANANQICRTVKDTIQLARLLGVAYFLPYLSEDNKNNGGINSIDMESILQEQIRIRSYQGPPLDLKKRMEEALKCGTLITTCPWIVEYLLQCDPATLLLPSYEPVLSTLLSLYKNVLVTDSAYTNRISASNKNFLRFHLGSLFSSKNFPDSAFTLKIQNLCNVADQSNGQKVRVDMIDEAGKSLIEHFFDDTFNRIKRILSWGKLEVPNSSISGEFRHIRPIPASEKSIVGSKLTAAVPKEKQLQAQLEATFFELYSPSVKRSVDFISERLTSNFVTIAKSQLFPSTRTMLANQGVFGVRAAEKCRMKISDEMNKFLAERCGVTVKLCLEQSVTPGVLEICQRIAIRKAKEAVSEWIKNYINAGMFPDMKGPTESANVSIGNTSQPFLPVVKSVPEDPPFEILILIHRTLRKLHLGEKIDLQIIDRVLSCHSLASAPWAFGPLLDWGVGLVAFQPQCLTAERMRHLVSLWKNLWNSNSRIINSRNLLLLSKSGGSRDSWIKLGSITQLLISEGLIRADDLEQQCLELLRDDWPDSVQKRISEFLTIVLETFQQRAEGYSESAQVLDWVAWICSGQPDQD